MSDTYSFCKYVVSGLNVEFKDYTTPFKVGKRDYDIKIDESKKGTITERRVDSLGRTRKKIYDLISCNVGKYPKFLTLTCAESILDYNEFLYEIKQFFKRMKRKGFDLRYIWVAEHQVRRGIKEGNEGSYHAHIIIFNDEYIDFNVINSCWNGNTDIHIFESCRYIDNNKTDEKIRNVAGYVVKYITKENLTEFGRNLYHCSRGLTRPVEIREVVIGYTDNDGNKKYIKDEKNIDNRIFDALTKNIKINYQGKPYIKRTLEGKYICCQTFQGKINNSFSESS